MVTQRACTNRGAAHIMHAIDRTKMKVNMFLYRQVLVETHRQSFGNGSALYHASRFNFSFRNLDLKLVSAYIDTCFVKLGGGIDYSVLIYQDFLLFTWEGGQ